MAATVSSCQALLLLAPSPSAIDAILTLLSTSSLQNDDLPPVELLTEPPSIPQIQASVGAKNHIIGLTKQIDLDADAFSSWIQLATPRIPQENDEESAPAAADSAVVDKYKRKLAKADKRVKALQADNQRLQEEFETMKDRHASLQIEMEQFSHDVQELQHQYTKVVEANERLLWDYLPSHDPSLKHIPPIDRVIVETVTQVGSYLFDATIGEGQYAAVYACTTTQVQPLPSSTSSPTVEALLPCLPTNLAVKAIDKSKLHDVLALVRVNGEIGALKDAKLRHASLLSLRDVVHTPKFIYLITERGGRDLFDFFGSHERIPEAMAVRISFKIVEAVKHMHSQEYCHRDLKPENILFTPETFVIKLVDFGLCAKVGAAPLTDFCGSPGFFAPEMLLQETYDGQKSDVWSVGCILLELVLGHTFFVETWMTAYQLEVLSDRQLFHKLIRSNIAALHQALNRADCLVSPKGKALLEAILCEDIQARPTIFEVAEHPWFEAQQLQQQQLQTSPSRRQASPKRIDRALVAASSSAHDVTRLKGTEGPAQVSPTRPSTATGKISLPSIKSEKTMPQPPQPR
ncbi:unnamed protein product [Aphanomyces euteiches]|uniref:Protein kinase domain-containing protein n=1 Tax=Aphanomyces euteiches TaxID=100861 RepID=A0A6G0XJF5_9STRA|nr:hypothetical protein Ae201684_004133 [Aphanomyces euteiches]KAH9151998.1 hypothetical protein AeRB84_005512 [Aphanomyces euteiches]